MKRLFAALFVCATLCAPVPAHAQLFFVPPFTRVTLANESNVTVSGNTSTTFDVSLYKEAVLYVNVTSWACTGLCSGGSIDLDVQSSDDGGTTWWRHSGSVATLNQTGVVNPTLTISSTLGELWRVRWQLTSTPTASFTMRAVFKKF